MVVLFLKAFADVMGSSNVKYTLFATGPEAQRNINTMRQTACDLQTNGRPRWVVLFIEMYVIRAIFLCAINI